MAQVLNNRTSPAKNCRWLGIRRAEKGSTTQFHWCGNFLERIGLWAITCSSCPAYEKKEG